MGWLQSAGVEWEENNFYSGAEVRDAVSLPGGYDEEGGEFSQEGGVAFAPTEGLIMTLKVGGGTFRTR